MIEFIDSNCMIGKRKVLREGSIYKTEEYLELLDRCGIEKALIYHSVAKENDIIPGNQMLVEVLKKEKRFMGQWVVMPSNTEECYTPKELILKMKENNIKSVRMFPKMHDYSLKPYSCGEMFKEFDTYKIPLFIEKSQIEWNDLYELLKNYPQMPVVLCETGYRCRRQVFPILEACENLYLESSTYVPNNGIEEFCKEFGAERMLFGSGVPTGSACGAVSLIRYACIDDEEKQKIASENLLGLIRGVSI